MFLPLSILKEVAPIHLKLWGTVWMLNTATNWRWTLVWKSLLHPVVFTLPLSALDLLLKEKKKAIFTGRRWHFSATWSLSPLACLLPRAASMAHLVPGSQEKKAGSRLIARGAMRTLQDLNFLLRLKKYVEVLEEMVNTVFSQHTTNLTLLSNRFIVSLHLCRK